MAWISLLAVLATGEARAQTRQWFQPWLGLDSEMTPHCAQPVGGRCALICPASDGRKGFVEGTDVYSDVTSVCAAAVHAGVLARGQSGAVVIVIGPSPKSYSGSVRNGVTSQSRAAPRSFSYRFATDGLPGIIHWTTTWSRVPADFRGPLTVICPADGEAKWSIWGTGPYTVDSSICTAAVHAGVITTAGGEITLQRSPGGLPQFPSSERNGVRSRAAGMNTEAFTVSAAGPGIRHSQSSLPSRPAPRPSEPPSGETLGAAPERTLSVAGSGQLPATRTFRLTGFTASGLAIPVIPRTIRLSGFTGSGLAIPVPPRTFSLPGWTASGGAIQGVVP